MKLVRIRNIAIIGAGIMGQGFAQVFAQKGFPVALYDIDEGILRKAFSMISERLNTFVEHKVISKKEKEETLERIVTCSGMEQALHQVDFVLEAVPELMDLKKKVFRDMDRFAPQHTILASNTSGLSITEMGSCTSRPEKTIIVHGVNPPYLIPVVEIVRGSETSDETAESTYRLMVKAGKKPVRLLKEVPGFVINRLQNALYREALYCLEAGVATAADIDRAVKEGFGLRMSILGPFETSDLGGLDTWYRSCQNIFPSLSDSKEAPMYLKRLVENGKLGVKTGEGFFKYSQGAIKNRIRERDENLIWLLRLPAGSKHAKALKNKARCKPCH